VSTPDPTVMPVPRSLFLCEAHIGYPDGRVDLYGIFNILRPDAYPYTLPEFVVFAQLTNGLGTVPFFLEIRRARDDALIRATAVHALFFPDRLTDAPLALTIRNVFFAEPGVYFVSLFCHNSWVGDTTLLLESP
jgi:hypothetical protein